MPVAKLKEFLDQNEIKYVSIRHSPAFTAQEIAASAHVSGRDLAKTVMVKVDGTMAMAVLPASFHIDFDLLKEVLGVKRVELATETDFQNLFPECEVGAMPPFGNLYGMETYVAESLTEEKEIAFNAGTHTELIKLRYRDFASLVKPKVVKFSIQNVA
jgi:Ala-tRNA(Pro) deacylase